MVAIAIIAGMQGEVDAFAPGLGRVENLHGLEVRQLEWEGVPLVLVSAGIGKVAATLATTAVTIAFAPRLLLALGTAGGLAPGDGAPHWLARAIQHDYGAARGTGFVQYTAGSLPLGEAVAIPFASFAQPAGIDLPEATIASGDCFVESPELSARVRDGLGASLIDMETAAIAQAAARLGLAWCGIKAASDDANHASAGDFESNFRATARRAAAAAERAVPLIAAALG
ncbi:hypothetical protein IP88_00580 [alpha proteobacterium AAP81b]|nr:hypothetical protein IP88_00580 [alpha proteobacterium AAP81b]